MLTLNELREATRWAEEHVRTVHAGSLPCADLALRNLPGAGIGTRTVVMCEACERLKVQHVNHHDVTDYGAW